jgi:formylglycine-generating enzyme required for sulfatase activity
MKNRIHLVLGVVLILIGGSFSAFALKFDDNTVPKILSNEVENSIVSSSVLSLESTDLVYIPGGEFEMGDHYGYVDPQHGSDELPIHNVSISSFYIGKNDVTVQQYCDYLNSALSQGIISVSSGLVYLIGGKDILFYTRQAYQYSRISWDSNTFSVLDNRNNHPITSVTWYGAAAYSNWRSINDSFQPCYNSISWDCNLTKNGYRLPTEAEWEYTGRGGQYTPYYNYPWGNDADKTKANWPDSGDPYEGGALPLTTPVGFYNGQLRNKIDFGWPGSQETYQTSIGANGYGLYDMAGNVWQWCNDWYRQDYYKVSPVVDPIGPTISEASPMPDGKPYHVLRGGNWYNGENDTLLPNINNGHSRVSNRDPAYYLGPVEEIRNSEVGFRIVRRNISGSENHAPITPNRPEGTTSGKPGTIYSYETAAVDPDGDQIYYWFNWGDESNSGWLGPYTSGIIINASHGWEAKGNYEIKVKAKDIHGLESDWSNSLPISMPKNLEFHSFFERFPYFLRIDTISIQNFFAKEWRRNHSDY